MKVTGFTFIRNGVMFDYPFLESLRSLLPLCDEIVVAVGKSSDDTLDRIKSLQSTKLKICETVWDESSRTGGSILSHQTNIALDHVAGDWAIYLQADEIIHERDYPIIRESMSLYNNMSEVEGILFNYKHFYGSYNYIGDSRHWYRREIRIVRPTSGLRSWGDAQGFRINGKKLHVKLIDATIYHYGWVKPPEIQQLKQKNFNKLWHSDGWIGQHIGNTPEYDYEQGGKLKLFEGTHPAVMMERVRSQHWQFLYNSERVQQPLKDKILDLIEAQYRRRIGEYKNYVII